MGEHSYELAINEYADLTGIEYRELLLGYKPYHKQNGSAFLPPNNILLPDKVDWRDKGYVTPVKNQGGLIINIVRLFFLYFSSVDCFTG